MPALFRRRGRAGGSEKYAVGADAAGADAAAQPAAAPAKKKRFARLLRWRPRRGADDRGPDSKRRGRWRRSRAQSLPEDLIFASPMDAAVAAPADGVQSPVVARKSASAEDVALADGTPLKGLANGAGENNCYVNVVIQMLWHLGTVRRALLRAAERGSCSACCGSARKEPLCVFCAVCKIFVQYQGADDESASVAPTPLRKALSRLFLKQKRFQMGKADDAGEAYEAIVTELLHFAEREGDSELYEELADIFQMTVAPRLHCRACKMEIVDDPVPVFPLHVYASQLVAGSGSGSGSESRVAFEKTLRDCTGMLAPDAGSLYCCVDRDVSSCTAPGRLASTLAISIVWETGRASAKQIGQTMEALPTRLDVGRVLGDRRNQYYLLKGVISFYNNHYVGFYFGQTRREWRLVDDSTVSVVGQHWADVAKKAKAGKMQPCMAVYERIVVGKNAEE